MHAEEIVIGRSDVEDFTFLTGAEDSGCGRAVFIVVAVDTHQSTRFFHDVSLHVIPQLIQNIH